MFAVICYSAHAQQWGQELGLNYVYANPAGAMGGIIDRGHGVTTHYGFVHPSSRLAFGLDVAFAQYGRDKNREEYTFDDGTVAPMDIIVSNSFANFMAYSKWYLREGGLLRPYVIGRVGYSAFSTNLNIYDPDDQDHCEPVENEVLQNDGTFVAAVGAGVKLDFASVFKRIETGRFFLEGNVNFMQGGNVRYMNADAHGQHPRTPGSSDMVTARFINTDTQVIHEHHVGYVFSSPVQITEFRLGVSMSIVR